MQDCIIPTCVAITSKMSQDENAKQIDGLKDKKSRRERLKKHLLAPTCICVDSEGKHAFTGSKDGSIIKWSLESKNLKIIQKVNSIRVKVFEIDEDAKKRHHFKHINCIAISSDDKFLATGGWDKLIRIWSPKDLTWLHTFSKHRGEVTALTFRIDYSLLYSGSADRSVMLWTLEDDDNRCFVEDLYGHESPITSIDILRREKILTSGGRDQSIRIWKVLDQSQAVFQSKHESVDIARYVDEKTFISGGEDGAISVWTTMKRKPVFTLPDAHPIPSNSDGKDSGLKPWILSLAAFSLKNKEPVERKMKKMVGGGKKRIGRDDQKSDSDSDSNEESESEAEDETSKDLSDDQTIALVASGSCNSEIRLWNLIKSSGKFDLKLVQTLDCPGFVNDLRFTRDGKRLVAACGREHRFGRWWVLKSARNSMLVFDVPKG